MINNCDILIIGASLGGVSAALSAASEGRKVILLSKYEWIGGQLTTQAVPADEHGYIDEFGSSESYRKMRQLIRDYYRMNTDLKDEYKDEEKLNPGSGWVSDLCVSPHHVQRVLKEMLSSYKNIKVLYNTDVVDFMVEKDSIKSVVTRDGQIIEANVFIDATDLGDTIPLLEIPYVTGAESKSMTYEKDAKSVYEPKNMQAITWCFAVSYESTVNHTIDKPALYNFFKNKFATSWEYSQIGWKYPNPRTLNTTISSLKDEEGKVNLFKYRQIYDPLKFESGGSPITIVNWPQNDYWDGPIFGSDQTINEQHYYRSKQVSLSLLYWLQTEGGYPNLKLCPEVMGTDDGFAMEPYYRESRRIKAKQTITQEMITPSEEQKYKAKVFNDTIGIGYYHLDLHPTTGGDNYFDRESLPFQIPLGAMIQDKYSNWLPGCKNIGSTHITNGCLRLHPVEWVIGEVSGVIANHLINKDITCQKLAENDLEITNLQNKLLERGVELSWPYEGDIRYLTKIDN